MVIGVVGLSPGPCYTCLICHMVVDLKVLDSIVYDDDPERIKI